jgi:hypothetical protein
MTFAMSFTYDHRTMKTELPVRSAVLKHCTGGLVVRWVTTSESPLLYVFASTSPNLAAQKIHTCWMIYIDNTFSFCSYSLSFF